MGPYAYDTTPMPRQNINSGTSWEALAGYSRAVRVGDNVFVSGTTAHDAQGLLHGGDDAYAQAAYILKKIEADAIIQR